MGVAYIKCGCGFYSFRRDLLKLIGVREFSLEAMFQDPCQSFVLPEVNQYNNGYTPAMYGEY